MTDDGKAALGLKYLELARGEILERTKFVNQTLGSYLLGTAALASWFYQAVYKPAEQGALAPAGLKQASAAVGFALMLSYLSLAVNWIIHHNERIVAALARFQRDNLSSVLGDDPPMWERSDALKSGDGLSHARGTFAIEELIVLGPPVAALIFALLQVRFTDWRADLWLAAALVANLLSLKVGIEMYRIKRALRSPEAGVFPSGGSSHIADRAIASTVASK